MSQNKEVKTRKGMGCLITSIVLIGAIVAFMVYGGRLLDSIFQEYNQQVEEMREWDAVTGKVVKSWEEKTENEKGEPESVFMSEVTYTYKDKSYTGQIVYGAVSEETITIYCNSQNPSEITLNKAEEFDKKSISSVYIGVYATGIIIILMILFSAAIFGPWNFFGKKRIK